MGLLKRLQYLRRSRRNREEREMREELDALAGIAAPGELGNLTLAMEDARAAWGWTWLGSLAADVRYAVRSLRSQPAFVAVAVLSLALAIGANSAVFSFADALLLRPLPVPKPSRVFDVSYTTLDNPFEGMSYPDYRDFREKCHSCAGVIAYRLANVAAAADSPAPARIRLAAMVSDNYFAALDVAISEGRSFSPGEMRSPVAVISADFGDLYNAGQPAIGSTVRLNGIEFQIVGAAPKSFPGLDRFSQPTLYIPLGMWQQVAMAPADPLEDRSRHELVVKARLADGVAQKSVQAELAAIGAGLEAAYPATDHNRRAMVKTELARRIEQTPRFLALIKMLMGLVGLILIIACSNLANLLLVRARSRSREIAIRLSIGAGRLRLVRQLMTESLLLAALGGAGGLVFGYGGILLLQRLSVPSEPPSVLGTEMDWRVAAFSFLAALASCIVFGLAPAWQSVRLDFLSALKTGGHGVAGPRRTIGRDLLVAGQIAMAMVVLIAAAMFLAGFRKMAISAPDIRVDHMITMDTAPALLHYKPAQIEAFYRQLADRARGLPGAADVAMTEALPLAPAQTVMTVVPEGYRFSKGREKTVEFRAAVDAAYFRVVRVEITRGRAFTEDDRTGSRRVAIVNEQFAKTYWPKQDPIGKRLRLEKPDGPWAEVVGVAKTGHYLVVNEAPAPFVYVPYAQNPRPRMTLVVQSQGDPAGMAGPLRDLVRSIDANVPVFNLRPVSVLYESRATGTWLEFFQMVGTIGFIGLVLATTGLYGLIAYTASRRVKEFGVRVALGAQRGDVVWLVERRGLILAAIGIAIGGVLTKLAAPFLAASFLGLGESPAVVYAIVPILLLTVSAAASYVPARRAARLDPLRALREE